MLGSQSEGQPLMQTRRVAQASVSKEHNRLRIAWTGHFSVQNKKPNAVAAETILNHKISEVLFGTKRNRAPHLFDASLQ